MELNATTLILIFLTPVFVITIIVIIITPYFKKNLPKTVEIEKRFKKKLKTLGSDFKVSSLDHRDKIKIKREELIIAINSGAFRNKWELQEFIDNNREELKILLEEYSEDVDEFLHNARKLAKEGVKKSTGQYLQESGYTDTVKVLKMNVKDFFQALGVMLQGNHTLSTMSGTPGPSDYCELGNPAFGGLQAICGHLENRAFTGPVVLFLFYFLLCRLRQFHMLSSTGKKSLFIKGFS